MKMYERILEVFAQSVGNYAGRERLLFATFFCDNLLNDVYIRNRCDDKIYDLKTLIDVLMKEYEENPV